MSKKLNFKKLLTLLKQHYTAPMQPIIKQFRDGVIFFATGLIIIYLASSTLPDSLKQEIIVLAGLVVLAAGFLVAMMAYVRLVISRIIAFIQK